MTDDSMSLSSAHDESNSHGFMETESTSHYDNPFGQENDKYWAQRYRLFSKFDEGIQLDKGQLSFFS